MMLGMSLLVGLLMAGHYLNLYLQHRERMSWMRMFSLQQGIPLPSMGTEKREIVHLPPKEKKKFSIPLPGADMFRRKVQ
jgi:hypothetical protein